MRLWAAYARLAAHVGILLLSLALVRLALQAVAASQMPEALGIDWHCNAEAARRWLSGDSYFLPRQLAGPYIGQTATTEDLGEVLYPPIALYLFVPFSLVPDIAWWVVPGALTSVALWQLRPAPWSWPVLALLLGASANVIVAGNPSMWLVPAALWGLLLGWPGALVLLKPSAFPLALLGITHRSWWIAVGVLGAASLVFGSLWLDWLTVMTNQQDLSAGYSLGQWPLLAIPFVVWAALPRSISASRTHAQPAEPMRSDVGAALSSTISGATSMTAKQTE